MSTVPFSIFLKGLFILTLHSSVQPPQAKAGLLISGGLGWGLFTFEPEHEEVTHNYFGVGPELTLGFSFLQKIDIALFVNYTPGHRGRATIGEENASLVFTGGQLSFRLKDKVFFGIRGGQANYHLLKYELGTDEVIGHWIGPTGGIIIGSIYKVNKTNYWQLSLDIMHSVLDKQDLTPQEVQKIEASSTTGKRRLDSFRLTVNYTFNSFIKSLRSAFKRLF